MQYGMENVTCYKYVSEFLFKAAAQIHLSDEMNLAGKEPKHIKRTFWVIHEILMHYNL